MYLCHTNSPDMTPAINNICCCINKFDDSALLLTLKVPTLATTIQLERENMKLATSNLIEDHSHNHNDNHIAVDTVATINDYTYCNPNFVPIYILHLLLHKSKPILPSDYNNAS